MNNIAYIFNDDFMEVNRPETPPINVYAILRDNYDIVDRNGNLKIILGNENYEICERTVKSIHEKRKQIIINEINNLYKIIAELEDKSNNVDNKEYIEYSEQVKKYSEMIDNLNNDLYNLKILYERKFSRIRPDTPELFRRENILKKITFNPESYFKPVKPIKDDRYSPDIPERRSIPTMNIPSNSGRMIEQMGSKATDVKGWDEDALETVLNWRLLFKEYKYIYEWILERNHRISTNLNLLSVVSSSAMGCFSAFKLWVQDDKTFQATSDIIMLFSNFIIAAVTTSSKRYIDDNRNEKIRAYLEEVSKFLGNITSELIKSPEYRMQADEFIKGQQELYSRLIVIKPNITIFELTRAKNEYKKFENSFLSFKSDSVQTELESKNNCTQTIGEENV